MRLLLEESIIRDVLLNREPDVHGSAAVLSIVEAGYASGFVAPFTLLNLYQTLEQKMSRSRTHGILADLLTVLSVHEMDEKIMLEALALGWSSFPQAALGAMAIHGKISHLIVRQPRDYRSLRLPVLTPEEFVAETQAETRESS